jgi:Ca2+-binding RTX toxin-like protein
VAGRDEVPSSKDAPAGAKIGDKTAEVLNGGKAAEAIYGAAGADKLQGQEGDDALHGGSDDDILAGGSGSDTLVGGSGGDRFVFVGTDHSKPGIDLRDAILDFDRGEGDRIDFSGIDAKDGVAGNQAFTFIGEDAFSGKAGQLHAVSSDGAFVVEGDVDGDRQADFQVELAGTQTLAAADFFL